MTDGFADEASDVVVAALLTTWVIGPETAEAVELVSPRYWTVIVWLPTLV